MGEVAFLHWRIKAWAERPPPHTHTLTKNRTYM